MRAGDVVFVKPSGWLSTLVAKIDGGPYSHVAIAVSETHIVEAQYFTRSRIWPVYEKGTVVMDLGLTDAQREEIVKNAISITGKWYDYKLIVTYFFRNVFKWNMKALWNSQNNLICSELVAMLLLSIEFGGATGLQGKNITPRELFEFLMKLELQKQEAAIRAAEIQGG